MKANFRSIISMAAIGISFALAQPWATSGATVVSMQVPASYVWDGRQFVGPVGNQFYYLGPGNVWIPMDRSRMNNFRAWETANPHWRSWATPNVRYRARPPQPVAVAPGVRPQPIFVQPQPIIVQPQPVFVNSPGTRSGGRAARSNRSRARSSTSLDTVPRLKPSPGPPSRW
jgi:PXPV repeat (3 copies)